MKKQFQLMLLAGLTLLPLGVAAGRPGKSQSAGRAEQLAAGKRIFDTNCASCHGAGIGNPGFKGKPGTEALQAKYNGEMPGLLEERTDLTPETVALFVRQGVTIMPFYRKTEINDAELAQLGAYLSRNNKDVK